MSPMLPRSELPRLRRPRRPLSLARLGGLVHRGIAAVNDTIEPFAVHWDEQNRAALDHTGPLWVSLGDSVTQGIGASHPDRSYPAQVLDELRRSTGEQWRLVNLSMSGARFADVIDVQLPTMQRARLEPSLVTAVIGSNDILWRRDTGAIVRDARRLVDSLPRGTLLSRVSEARPDRRRRGINEVFVGAQRRGIVGLFEAWDWPSGVGVWAEDRFHPNDRAHRYLADNVWSAVERHLQSTA